MKQLLWLIFFTLLSGCASLNKPKPLIGQCINWMPLLIDDNGGREDATPHSVLISIDKSLESKLISLVPYDVPYKQYCWYRSIESGGIALYPPWKKPNDSFMFEYIDGSWVFKGEQTLFIH